MWKYMSRCGGGVRNASSACSTTTQDGFHEITTETLKMQRIIITEEICIQWMLANCEMKDDNEEINSVGCT